MESAECPTPSDHQSENDLADPVPPGGAQRRSQRRQRHLYAPQCPKHLTTKVGLCLPVVRNRRASAVRAQADSGDVVLFKTKGWGTRFQRYLTSSDYDHVGLIVRLYADDAPSVRTLADATIESGSRSPSGVYVLEAVQGRGVMCAPWEDFYEKGWAIKYHDAIVLRKLLGPRSVEFQEGIWRFARDHVGLPYNVSIARLLVNAPGGRKEVSEPSANNGTWAVLRRLRRSGREVVELIYETPAESHSVSAPAPPAQTGRPIRILRVNGVPNPSQRPRDATLNPFPDRARRVSVMRLQGGAGVLHPSRQRRQSLRRGSSGNVLSVSPGGGFVGPSVSPADKRRKSVLWVKPEGVAAAHHRSALGGASPVVAWSLETGVDRRRKRLSIIAMRNRARLKDRGKVERWLIETVESRKCCASYREEDGNPEKGVQEKVLLCPGRSKSLEIQQSGWKCPPGKAVVPRSYSTGLLDMACWENRLDRRTPTCEASRRPTAGQARRRRSRVVCSLDPPVGIVLTAPAENHCPRVRRCETAVKPLFPVPEKWDTRRAHAEPTAPPPAPPGGGPPAQSKRAFFCSELVAEAFKALGVFSSDTNSANFWPVCFTVMSLAPLPFENGYGFQDAYIRAGALDHRPEESTAGSSQASSVEGARGVPDVVRHRGRAVWWASAVQKYPLLARIETELFE